MTPTPEQTIAGRDLDERILETTLDLGEELGWENVRLHQVAERLELPLVQIAARYRDLDAVANAWFTRARDTMLEAADERLRALPPPERLHAVIMRWFDALRPHRELTGEILSEKLYLSHPHHWVPMIFDLSRLIHWFLDAATIRSTGRQRQLAEVGLTLIFLATLRVWLRDQTPEQLRTRSFLRRQLESADRRLARRGIRPAVDHKSV